MIPYAECHGWQDDGQCRACGTVYGDDCRMDKHHDACPRHPRNEADAGPHAPCQCAEIDADIREHLAEMEIDSIRNGE